MRYQSARTLAVALLMIDGTNGLAALAQSAQTFEVASVRRVEIPSTVGGVPVFPAIGGIGTSNPTRITYRGAWLTPLIAQAFGVRSDQVTGPAWLKTDRYDIVAIISQGATQNDFTLMLADLLRDRFRLRFHMDSKTRPVYALRVGSLGPKLRQTERRAGGADLSRAPVFDAVDPDGCPVVSANYQGMVSRPVGGAICWTARDVPLEDLARLLEQPAGRPVIDDTGLTERYDFTIRFQWLGRAADTGTNAQPAPTSSRPSRNSLVETRTGDQILSRTRHRFDRARAHRELTQPTPLA